MRNRIRESFNSRKSDREIRKFVRRQLDHEGRERLSRVRCDVHEGTAILWGTVRNGDDRRLAAQIAQRCPRIEAVVNRIQVNPVILSAA